MFESALEVANSLTHNRSSKYDDLFTPEEKLYLTEFTTWLVETCQFKKTSASSYRANFSRAQVKIQNNVALNSDERSALRKFAEFTKS